MGWYRRHLTLCLAQVAGRPSRALARGYFWDYYSSGDKKLNSFFLTLSLTHSHCLISNIYIATSIDHLLFQNKGTNSLNLSLNTLWRDAGLLLGPDKSPIISEKLIVLWKESFSFHRCNLLSGLNRSLCVFQSDLSCAVT
eukprot:sb/3474281/